MVQFNVPDMTCGGCANRIGRALAQVSLPADLQVEIDVAARQVRVPVAAESEVAGAVRDAIARAGYAAAVSTAVPPASAGTAAGGCCCTSRRSQAVDAGQSAPAKTAGCCG